MSDLDAGNQAVQEQRPPESILNRLKRYVEKVLNSVDSMMRNPAFRKQIIWTSASIVLAMLVAAIIMVLTGYNPALAYIALIRGAVVQWDRVLFYATPLIFTGLSVALAFKCGLFNIGPEGQLYMGAMAAAIIGYMVSLPIVVHPLACLTVAALAGFGYGFVPGLLKAYRGAHEVVTTMMLSYTAILFTQWLVTYPLKEPGEFQWIAQTPLLFPTAWLPHLFGSDFLHAGLIIALFAVVGVHFLINRTVLGYELRAVGLNAEAARTAGINPKWNIALSLGIAGALAGVGGGAEILGYHHRFRDAWSTGLGWDGITVAVLGHNNPWGVLLGAIFFGALRAGGNSMQVNTGVPQEMVTVIQGLIVVFVAAPRIIDWLEKRGIDYSAWIRRSPMGGIGHLATTVWAAGSAIEAMIIISFFLEKTPFAGLLVALAIIVGFYALTKLLAQNPAGPVVSLFTAVEWILIATVAALLGSSDMVYFTAPTAVIGIAVSLMTVMSSRASTQKAGGN